MKNRIFLFNILVMIIISVSSCNSRHYINTTEIFSDGSCRKTMSLSIDSSDAGKQLFPILLDTSWDQSLVLKTPGENTLQLTAGKFYRHVEDFNHELKNDSNYWSLIDHSVKLDKKFRWFYTYLTYTETYRKANPYNLVPVTDYISADELKILTEEPTEYLAGRDSAEIQKIRDQIMGKAFQWLNASVFEEFLTTLEKNAHLLEFPAITSASIREKKDTIWHSIKQKEGDVSEILFDVDSMLTICSKCFDSQSFDKLRPAVSPAFAEYMEKGKKIDMFFNSMSDDEQNTVIMPGLLTNTNCKTVIGNKVQWQFSILKCYFNDYQVQVTSRVTNRFAFIVSGFLLMLVIAGIIGGAFLRRRSWG